MIDWISNTFPNIISTVKDSFGLFSDIGNVFVVVPTLFISIFGVVVSGKILKVVVNLF